MAEPELDGVSAEIANVFANVSDILDEAAESLATFTDEAKDSRPALHRADSAIAYGRVQVGLANPKIIPRNIADEIQDSAAGLRNQLSQAVADEGGDIGSAADVFLASLSRLRLPDLTEETATAAADRFRKSLNPRLAKLKAEMGRIEERVNQVSQISGEQAETLTQRLDTLKGEIDASDTRVQELISDQDAKFTEAQEERRREFSQALDEARASLSETETAIAERRDAAVARLEEIETEIAEMAAALGGRATAMGHGEESKEQAELAEKWSRYTIWILLVAAVVPLGLVLFEPHLSTGSAGAKIAVGLIIAGAAGYTAGIARHHRERSASARRLELEMNSFDTFIAPLDGDERNDLRSTIIWRFFGPENEAQQPDSEPRPRPRLVELLHLKREKRTARQEPSADAPETQ